MAKRKKHASSFTQFHFDVNNSPLFKKDNRNFINVTGHEQMNSLQFTSLLDIRLSKNNIVEPHYHQHADELLYCISGALTVSLLNPYTKKLLSYTIASGQVVNVPQGWWHYIVANADDSHLLGIFNQAQPEVILGSDLLALTPPNIMAHTYCLNEQQWTEATRPVQPDTFIGPPKDCHLDATNSESQNSQQLDLLHPYSKRKSK